MITTNQLQTEQLISSTLPVLLLGVARHCGRRLGLALDPTASPGHGRDPRDLGTRARTRTRLKILSKHDVVEVHGDVLDA